MSPRRGVFQDSVTYTGAHRRVYVARGPASAHACSECGAAGRHWAYVGGAPDETTDELGRPYSGDPARYTPKCVPCHKNADLAAGGFTPAPCGTEKGYERHRREGSPRCQPCKTAHATAESARILARTTRRS